MKRTLLTIIAIVAVAFTASAQQKGENYLGLNLGYETSKQWSKVVIDATYFDEEQSVTAPGGDNFGIGLEYGYFVANNLLVKLNAYYGLDKLDEDVSHSLNVTPGLAYYVRLAKGFYYTPNISLGYIMSATKQTDDSFLKANGFAAELQPIAVEFRPTKHFAMSVSLGSLQYAYLTCATGDPDIIRTNIDIHGLNFSLLKSAQVGFKFYF